MTRQYQFRYSGSPRVADHLAEVGMLAMAMFLTAVAIISVVDPSQRAGNVVDDLGIWFVAAIAWTLPTLFGLGIWRRARAYREGKPAIAVDDSGITLPGWTGKPVEFKWSDVTGLELEQRRGKSTLRIRAATIVGAASLDGLDVNPAKVWDLISQCRERR
jgi:hypothetical protein